ncbi:MAG: hypothetical protein NPIRA04_21670 [Nitrospirales bacterium]|nr:MAG: hypothetical protein NPIRA04_21670 [Nitrospirales bacterium]
MRKPSEITVDRGLLLYLLNLAEPHGFMSDVKFQQLMFLSELQMFGKGFKGLHYEFMRFAYGAFSKDVDNDLLFLRKKERLENFSLTDQAQQVVKLIDQAVKESEVNEQIMEILQEVVATYGPQDNGQVMESVEAIEISSTDELEQKIAIRDISFHTVMLVPSRIEVTGTFTVTSAELARLNKGLGA